MESNPGMKTQHPHKSPTGSRLEGARVVFDVLAALLLLSSTPSLVLGEGVVRDSIGPIPSGRGAANIAYADNLATINDNPAALAKMDGLHLEVDVDFLKTDLNFRNPLNDANATDELFVLPAAMASLRVATVPAPITVGFGFYMPAGFGAEFHLKHPLFGERKTLSRAGVYKFMPTASVDLGKGLTLGAGIGPAFEQAKFRTPYTFQSGAFAGVPGLVDTSASGFGYSWNVGIQYRPTDRWTIGVAYVSETQVDLEGNFRLDLTGVPLPIPLPDPTAKYDVKMDNTWPRSVGVGTSYRFDCGTLGLDVLWYNWSSAYDALTFHLSNGSNPVINAIAGSKPSDKLLLEWHDSFTVRVGGEYFLTENDTLRAGYIYITNPVPDRTLTPLIPANLEHSIALGYGHKFGAVGVDLAYQFSFGTRQGVGTSVIGSEYDRSTMLSMAHWFYIGTHISF